MQISKLREYEDVANPYLREYLAAKSAFDQAERHLKIKQAELLAQMQADHAKTLTFHGDGTTKQVTYVSRKTYTVDEKGLRRALTAKVFDRYTEKRLNRKALEDAMDRGEVDPVVVARFVSEAESKPYLKYTEKDEPGE